MEKREFIKSLIVSAQENVWKNELAIAYKEAGQASDLKVEAAKHAIERDQEYIAFLNSELEKCESSK